jgi:hypothetical protein
MDLKSILKRATDAGCRISRTSRGHWRILCPGGGLIFTAGTPSDWRGLRNLKADLKRVGVMV